MSNVHYKEVHAGRPAWEQRAEDHASNGNHFAVRGFNKRLHWEFLEDLCLRYDLEPRFDARERSVYFERKGGAV